MGRSTRFYILFALLSLYSCKSEISVDFSSKPVKKDLVISQRGNTLPVIIGSSDIISIEITNSSSSDLSSLILSSSTSNFTVIGGGSCTSTLGAGESCTFNIQFNSPGGAGETITEDLVLSYSKDGTEQSAPVSVSGQTSLQTISVSSLYPNNGANWNDYIKNNGTDIYSADDTACVAGIDIGYKSCLHGAEFKVAELLGVQNCSSLSIYDELDAFRWECDDSSTPIKIYSFHLKEDKSLSGLIDSVNKEFKDNKLKVFSNGNLIAESILSKWWSNSIVEVPDSSSAMVDIPSDAVEGKIHLVSTDTLGMGFNIVADKTAIVVMEGAKYSQTSLSLKCNGAIGGTSSPDSDCTVTSAGVDHLWFEGEIKGITGNTDRGVQLRNIRHSQFRRIMVSGFRFSGFAIQGSSDSNKIINAKLRGADSNSNSNIISSDETLVYDINYARQTSAAGTGSGLILGGTGIIAHKVKGSNAATANTYSGMLDIVGDDFILSQVLLTNNKKGIEFAAGSARTTILNATYGNNDIAVELSNSSSSTTFVNNLFVNNEEGIISPASNNNGTYVLNSAFLDNSVTALNLHGASSKVEGYLVMNDPTAGSNTCVNGGGGGDVIENTTCTNSGTDGSSDFDGGSASSATLWTTDADTYSATALKFKSSENDITNLSDNGDGTANFNVNMDWFHFDSWFKTYGKDGSTYPNSDSQGACLSGICRIWDWRVNNSNPLLYNNSQGFISENGNFVAGLTCPGAVNGNQVVTDNQTVPNTFLKSALEVFFDNKGDDDGLCESGEACIYSPNIGVYQGEGDFRSQGICNFVNGIVSNVEMYSYPIN